MGALWNKLFRRDLFVNEKHFICFAEGIHYCEDVLLLFEIIKGQSIAVEDKALYNYIVGDESTSHGIVNERKLTILDATSKIAEVCETKYPTLCGYVNYYCAMLKVII